MTTKATNEVTNPFPPDNPATCQWTTRCARCNAQLSHPTAAEANAHAIRQTCTAYYVPDCASRRCIRWPHEGDDLHEAEDGFQWRTPIGTSGTERVEPERRRAAMDAAEAMWNVVANVSGGDWCHQSTEWREAAVRAREMYHAALGILKQTACGVCGCQQVEIRSRYTRDGRRTVCPTCLAERMDTINEMSAPNYGVAYTEAINGKAE